MVLIKSYSDSMKVFKRFNFNYFLSSTDHVQRIFIFVKPINSDLSVVQAKEQTIILFIHDTRANVNGFFTNIVTKIQPPPFL